VRGFNHLHDARYTLCLPALKPSSSSNFLAELNVLSLSYSLFVCVPEIDLGACPDVAGTYDLPRAGPKGRGMALAALELNGHEARGDN